MVTKYQLAIFDFDGTLADSFPFFVRVFNQLAQRHDFRSIAETEIPDLRHYSPRQMMRHVGLPGWKLPLVASSFMSLMKQNAASIALFAQVPQMLECLHAAGVKLAIVSSNSHDNVNQVLGPANTQYISLFECGMSMFGKTARIRKVLKKTGIAPSDAIYIGDQVTDLQAARKASVPFGAVAWGYAAIESLRQHAPDAEFLEVAHICRIA